MTEYLAAMVRRTSDKLAVVLLMFRNRLEPRVLGSIAAIAFVLWHFVELADEVVEEGAREIDTTILTAFRTPGAPTYPLGPVSLGEVVRDVSGLGSLGVLGLLVSATVGALLLAGKHRTAVFVLVATLGGTLVSSILKLVVDRPRPDFVLHGTPVYDASFPSGHAMMSAVVYLTLGALITPLIQARWLKLYVMAMAILLSGLIGLSRVYLGVHWPSDVVAGWAVGAVWALGCWVVAKVLDSRSETKHRKKHIEINGSSGESSTCA